MASGGGTGVVAFSNKERAVVRDFVDELKIRVKNLAFSSLSCLVFHDDVSFSHRKPQKTSFVQNPIKIIL